MLMGECERLKEILYRIEKACERSGRDPDEVTLLGASKKVPPERLEIFYSCGLKTFGENRVQEFLTKYEALRDLDIEWHFIGRLQTNKVKYLMGKVLMIHSLDRQSLADEIDKRSGKAGITQRVLIEVNLGGEESKGGVSEDDLPALVEYTLSKESLKLLGLMAIPPYFPDPEDVRPYFVRLRDLRDRISEEFGIKLPHLSMGMSHDYEVAVEEGATIVRVGTALFGERD